MAIMCSLEKFCITSVKQGNVLERKSLRSGVNFNNILRADFMCADPEGTKKTESFTVFFALLESACAKVAYKMFVKLTPRPRLLLFIVYIEKLTFFTFRSLCELNH